MSKASSVLRLTEREWTRIVESAREFARAWESVPGGIDLEREPKSVGLDRAASEGLQLELRRHVEAEIISLTLAREIRESPGPLISMPEEVLAGLAGLVAGAWPGGSP